ncbi:hypothetical protein [Nocardioides cavernaquae]|uniref:WD40 repeat domain-containing protein n=1 Tax=Nocardioides cavernaquae TaxID=2321396 RepID=A0A3A5H8T8_9ACTN|nr:hypothetical protein [Nocardioides cavernaquae]RJS46832.1 hypothetical protein D4739_11820 [Nocardioides cavernaquae]
MKTWAELEKGVPPRIPYIQDDRYVTPSGPGLDLPTGRRGVSGVARFSGGLLLSDATYFEGTNGIALVKDGARVRSWPSAGHCSSGGPIGSADGEYVAWVTVRCPESEDTSVGAVHVARVDGTGEVTQPVGAERVAVVGFLGRSVVYNTGFIRGAWITSSDGRPRRIPGVDTVQAVSPATGDLIGQVADRAHLVLDGDGEVLWRAPTGGLVSFSPDGTKVLGIVAPGRLSVLHSRTGDAATTIDMPRGADLESVVWETERTLLTLLRCDGAVAIVRVHLDGHIERATLPLGLEDDRSPYVLVQAWAAERR